MRLKLRALWSYRPCILTVIVVTLIAAILVLANLTFDQASHIGFIHKSYGWPFIWHRFVFVNNWRPLTIGWYLSPGRLAGNVVLWLLMLAVPAGGCEWLLRRYQPRLRWSLRTMLAGIALMGAMCAWFAAARDRANLNDRISATLGDSFWVSGTQVERWGPKWLSLLRADRFRSSIVFAETPETLLSGNPDDEDLLQDLARLPDLRWLELRVDALSRDMVDALNRMWSVRTLAIEHDPFADGYDHESDLIVLPPIGGMGALTELCLWDVAVSDESLSGLKHLKSISLMGGATYRSADQWHESLAVIGKLAQLEHLELSNMRIDHNDLACLSGLTNLKTLRLRSISGNSPHWLKHLPPLPRLTVVELAEVKLDQQDLGALAPQPELRTLELRLARVEGRSLAGLARLISLTELTLESDFRTEDGTRTYLSTAGLESLLALERIEKLHLRRAYTGLSSLPTLPLDNGNKLTVEVGEREIYRRALRQLRKVRRCIVVDGRCDPIAWRWSRPDLIIDPYPHAAAPWLPTSGHPWLNPKQRADFEEAGGWGRFDSAERRRDDGVVFRASF